MDGILTIPKFYLVELNVGANAVAAGQQVNFLNQQLLKDKRVVGIEVFENTSLTTSATSKVVVTPANLRTAVLVLKEKSFDRAYQYPCYNLVSINRYGIIPTIQPIVVNWEQSYVKFTAAGVGANESILFGIHYL